LVTFAGVFFVHEMDFVFLFMNVIFQSIFNYQKNILIKLSGPL